jgi:cytochrome bd-type quinol oxidase subunit 2
MNRATLKIFGGVLAAFTLGGQVGKSMEGVEIEPYRYIVMGVFMVFFLYTGIKELKNE